LSVFDTEEEMNAAEISIVTENFISRKDTYNISLGGEGGWSHVNSLEKTDEYRKALSISQKKRWENQEERNNISKKLLSYNETHGTGRISRGLKKRYSDDTFKEKFDMTMNKVNKCEDKRKSAGSKIKDKWQDPIYLEKMKKRKSPDSTKTSNTMKAKWQDPVFREKMKNRKRKGWKQNETNQD
jgi:hypothetical protein